MQVNRGIVVETVRLSENEWQFINEIIYKIYSITELAEMRKTFLSLIMTLIPCDSCTFYLADSKTIVGSPVQFGLDQVIGKYIDEKFYEQDYMRWIYLSGLNRAFRQSDYISNEEQKKTTYYKLAYAPVGIEYQLGLSLSYQDKFLGVVSLYRNHGHADFSQKDIYILNIFIKHLSLRLHMASSLSRPTVGIESLFYPGSECQEKYKLTNREIKVLYNISCGLSTDDICKKLCIAKSTFHKHVLNIYQKFDVSNRYELMNIVNNILIHSVAKENGTTVTWEV